MNWPRVAVVGPGAVGAYFGGMLARAGAQVTLIGRPGKSSSHLDAVRTDGLRMKTTSFDERVGVEVSSTLETLANAQLILFAVKTTDTETAAQQMAPHLDKDSIVLDLQNGVDNPERMRHQGLDPFPAVVYVAAAIESPGEITHRGRGDLVIGHPTRKEELIIVKQWLEAAEIPCVVSTNVELELWNKLVLNSMSNATSALTDKSYGQLAGYEPTWRVALEVLDEAVLVAGRLGHTIDRGGILETATALLQKIGNATSSTQQDVARGRLTEIDSLNGYIAERGATLGVPTPVNRTLWALVKLREQKE